MDLRIRQGTLLASAPSLLDPNFMHAVVLMVQHTEEGAYGLIVNRESEFRIGELLSEHPVLSKTDFPVHWGGPVGEEMMQILHRAPKEIPGSTQIGPQLYLGGDLDAVAEYIEADPVRALASVRFVLGYSGWGAGQLEFELQAESWLPAAVETPILFAEEDQESFWRRVVRTVGGDATGFDLQPPDVSWN